MEGLTLYRGVGCKECKNSGFKDRTGLYEVVEITPELKDLISQRRTTSDLMQYLRKHKVKTLADCCLAKVLAGEVPIEEFIMINMGS